jgi:hypothetical protein
MPWKLTENALASVCIKDAHSSKIARCPSPVARLRISTCFVPLREHPDHFRSGWCHVFCSSPRRPPGADTVHVLIEAGSAPQTLVQFSQQTQLQLLFRSEVVANRMTRAVNGSFEPTEALAKMLAGSGLVFDIVNEKTIVVDTSHPTTANTAAGPRAISLPLALRRHLRPTRPCMVGIRTAMPESTRPRLLSPDRGSRTATLKRSNM